MPRVQHLFAQSTYSPERLKILGNAFDQAWDRIAGGFSDSGEIEAARVALAKVILSLPGSETDNAERISTSAIHVMGAGYRGVAMDLTAAQSK